jgi:hypothetical protein
MMPVSALAEPSEKVGSSDYSVSQRQCHHGRFCEILALKSIDWGVIMAYEFIKTEVKDNVLVITMRRFPPWPSLRRRLVQAIIASANGSVTTAVSAKSLL